MLHGSDSVLGYVDSTDYQAMKYGANVNEDLKELWKCIAFSICVSNNDDHLRNHGFIPFPLMKFPDYSFTEWTLSSPESCCCN